MSKHFGVGSRCLISHRKVAMVGSKLSLESLGYQRVLQLRPRAYFECDGALAALFGDSMVAGGCSFARAGWRTPVPPYFG